MDRKKSLLVAVGVLLFAGRAHAQPAITWHAASPSNYTASGSRNITTIVIHKAEGTAYATWNWFQNPGAGASAHYVVDSDGSVIQMVGDGDIAWHAGNWAVNQTAIGIEQNGYTYRDDVSDSQLRGLAALTSYLCDQYGIPKDRAHIIGHDEVPDPNNPGQYGGVGHHTDPGPYFDWATFMSYVGGSASPPPPPPPPASTGASFAGLEATAALNVRDAAWGNVLTQVSSGTRFAGTGNEDQGFSEVWYSGGTAWLYTGYLTRRDGDGGQVSVGTLNVRYDQSTDPSTIVGQAYQGQVYVSIEVVGDWRLIQFDTRREWVWHDYCPWVKLD